jgi:glycogen(starch) synthase
MFSNAMRVLMLSWEYPPHMVGGVGAHVSALVPALARRGISITVITPRWAGGDPESRISPSALVYRVDPSLPPVGNYFADAKQTNLQMERYANAIWSQSLPFDGRIEAGYDLIHAHDWLVGFAAIALKGLHKTPLVVTLHATERGRGRGHLPWEISSAIHGAEWSLAFEAWRVITPSHSMSEEVSKFFQLPTDKISVVPNGVDTARFDHVKGADLPDFRQRWAKDDEHIVFFVGRMEAQKGANLLVEAAPRVLSQFPQAKFILAGTGGMEHSLRRRLSELGLGDKVSMTGYLPDLDRDRLYRIADLSVFPSLYEPFGIVALEAMAAKCPVVVSDVGGLKEVVKHNETGIIVHTDNVESLTWGILHTLRRPDWSAQRAANAYHTVREEYNWDRIAERTAELYASVIDERRQVKW